MKRILIVVIVVLASAAFAQERAVPMQPQNTVYVGADGKFEAPPDTAVLQFNISAQEETSQAASDRASKAAEQIRQMLRKHGVDPKAAQVGFYSLDPVYDYRNPKRKLVGYRVNTGVSVKLKDFSKIGPIIQDLSDFDVTQNQSLSYMLEDMDAAKTKAVEDALMKARRSASAVAQAGGRTLGELSSASVDTFEAVPMVMRAAQPRMAMAGAQAAPAPTEEFSAQKITVTAHVNALFLLK
jgi:uncharacterized protein YggE